MKMWPHCDIEELATGIREDASQPPLFSGVPFKGEKLQRISGTARFWAVDPEMPRSLHSSPTDSNVKSAERCQRCGKPFGRGDEECRRSGCR